MKVEVKECSKKAERPFPKLMINSLNKTTIALFSNPSEGTIIQSKIMKTRIKKEQFKQVEYTDLIGIKWKSGEKGILLETKEGIICLNNNVMNVQNCFATLTKSDYLTRESVKRDQEKVYVFENLQPLLKWFTKK